MTLSPATAGATLAVRLIVRGQVQGVGFRPFVYRLATDCGLGGRVRNAPEGVVIEVEGPAATVQCFERRLVQEAPAPAAIDGVLRAETTPTGLTSFAIDLSAVPDLVVVRVPRDLATCPACRQEIFDNKDRRNRYPFTNCTACGPRFSILLGLPYDRPVTAMRHFIMCSPCAREYHAPTDRRFHAQPNACAACGPQVALWDHHGRNLADPTQALTATAQLLRQGQIVALKGLGGFQLLVRADQSEAVRRLRQRKCRPSKPLAVMVGSLAEVERLAHVGAVERQLLQGVANPIVLLEPKKNVAGTSLAPEIAPGVNTLGLFLPTTPLHHLLLAEVGLPLVATSGNHSEEPIVIDEREALHRLGNIADAFLVHNRPVVRRVDDSVVRVIGGRAVTFRLARGYAPLPLTGLEKFLAERGTQPPLFLATGGHQKSALALWTGAQAVLAQHLGDLDHPEARAAMEHAWQDLAKLFHFQPTGVAHDAHPDYFTTAWAQQQHKPTVAIQHHHAHAAACASEHGLLGEEVLAFTWDGTGYGPDGTIWGGEVLRVRGAHYQRVGALLPFPLPGGEAAIRRPGRIVLGLLWTLGGAAAMLDNEWPRRLDLTPAEVRLLAGMIQRGLNAPWTSSLGRLFDGVAALALGIKEVSYEGEAAVWLEAAAEETTESYTLPVLIQPAPRGEEAAFLWGDWRPLFNAVRQDIDRGVSPGRIAARFHNALAHWAAAVAERHPGLPIVLSGGCFQNRLLTERTVAILQSRGRQVFCHGAIPPGDGGLAAGQLAVALAQG